MFSIFNVQCGLLLLVRCSTTVFLCGVLPLCTGDSPVVEHHASTPVHHWWSVLLYWRGSCSPTEPTTWCAGVMFYYCVLVRCSTTGVLVYQQSPLVRYTALLVRAAVRLQSPLSGSKSARLPSHCLISPTTVPYQNRENLNVKINKVEIVQTNGPHFWTQYEALILNFFLDIGKITRNASLWFALRKMVTLFNMMPIQSSKYKYVQLYFFAWHLNI